MIATLVVGAAIAGTILSPSISDDSPAFDCATMGNQVCGSNGYLFYFYTDGNGTPQLWSFSPPINGKPECGSDAQCEQYFSGE